MKRSLAAFDADLEQAGAILLKRRACAPLQPAEADCMCPCASACSGDSGVAECSSTAGPHSGQPHHAAPLLAVAAQLAGQWQCGASGKAGAAAEGVHVLERLLERALTDADAALQLTTNAMCLATHICSHGASSAADAALHLAEQALAATMHQLAMAQALVAHKAHQQQAGDALVECAAADDEELQDTCSSVRLASC